MRRLLPLVLALLVAACSGGAGSTTTAASTSSSTPSTTPTTDPGEGCRRLADDAYGLLAAVVAELAGVTPEQLADPAQWPESLHALQAQGRDLDRRAAELGCDPGAVQQEVAVRASSLPATGLGRLLLDLLFGRAG